MQNLFFKLIRADWKHFDKTYNLGPHRFDGQLDPDSETEGLYFCHLNDIPRWTHLHDNFEWVCAVRLFPDSKVIQQGHKFKTNHFELMDPVPIQEFFETHFSAWALVEANPDNIKYVSDTIIIQDVDTNIQKYSGGLHITRTSAGSDYDAFRIMRDQHRWEIYEYVVKKDGNLLQFIPKPPIWVQELAIQQNPLSIRYLKRPNKEICELALQKNGLILGMIESRTPEICKMALRQNGLALQFLTNEEKTNELEILAIKQNAYAIQFVRKQTVPLCWEAFIQNKHVKDLLDPELFEKFQTYVVLRNGKMLRKFEYADDIQHAKN